MARTAEHATVSVPAEGYDPISVGKHDGHPWRINDCFPSQGWKILLSFEPWNRGFARRSFFGRQTVKSPVLYVSLDNSAADMDQFLEELGVTSEDQIFIQPKPIPDNAEEWLVDVIKRNGYKLVIIDTLQRFFQLEDDSSYSEATNRMAPLDNQADEIGFHILYVHHSGKNGSYLGSTAFKAMCPTFLELMRVGELQQRILKSDNRHGNNFESVAIGKKHGWLEIAGTYEDAQVNEVMPKIRELLEVHDGEGVSETTIRKEMPARGIITSKAIRSMLDAGTIERTGQGKKGDPYRYHLAKTLSLNDPLNSYSLQGGENSGQAGQESKKSAQPIVDTKKNSSPEFWDKNGTSTDKDDGWEIIK